ncbi:MAG: DUF2497 domain-containing protein [Proteobacteria bacterium]|nr:DUF2497 domain-containing protein [Pseudomonadota bacterium]
MVAQQAEMEDIISSIRTTLAEETAKVGGGSKDLIDAAAEQDDVLELTSEEMVEVPASVPAKAEEAGEDDLVDIAAFASSGEAKVADAQKVNAAQEDLLGENPPAPTEAAPAPEPKVEVAAPQEEPKPQAPTAEAAPQPAEKKEAPAQGGESADEFDKLLAQISQDQEKTLAAAEEQKKALLEDDDVEQVVEASAAPVELKPTNGAAVSAQMMDSVEGMKVALPAEILAMALRPLVQEWLQEHLADVVNGLVKEEITKLSQN